MVYSIISIILWILYSIIEGKREVYYYQLLATTSFKRPNIHYLYFLQRGVVLILIGLVNHSILLPLSLAFIFPFIHDGFYYMKYNDYYKGVYEKRFMSSSTTSTAVLEFNFVERILMLIAGIFILFLYYEFNFIINN